MTDQFLKKAREESKYVYFPDMTTATYKSLLKEDKIIDK